METKNAPFIGTEQLTELATSVQPEIAMKAYFDRKALFDKMGIKVISGIQFKDLKYLILRKGHTTRRKVIGETVKSTAGKILGRELTTYLAWNRYLSNKKAYREYPVIGEDGSELSYPQSETNLRLVLSNYSDDVYDCFWHGNIEIGNGEQGWLGLYDGVYTCIKKDIEAGNITPIHLSGTIAAPEDKDDISAYRLFQEFRNSWDVHLQGAPKVYVAMNAATAEAIADAYGNAKGNNKEVIYLENGNYRFPQWPNIEVTFDASLGTGTKMIAYTEGNIEYGVDTENPENSITVQVGDMNDADNVWFQVQTAQGVRIYNINAGSIAVTDATMAPVGISGDYTSGTYAVNVNNEAYGSVTVNGQAPDNSKKYAIGETITLVATAKSGAEFVKWSNGKTEKTITIIATGDDEAITAIFTEDANS